MTLSLVHELRRDAFDSTVACSALLRRALALAWQLDINDMRDRLQRELRGYSNLPDVPVPAYRMIRGEFRAKNPVHGWIPVDFRDPVIQAQLSEQPFRQPIGEIEALLQDHKPEDELGAPFPELHGQLPVYLVLSPASLQGILDAVRTEILEWTLQLEKDGVDRGASFSEVPRCDALSEDPSIAISAKTMQQTIEKRYQVFISSTYTDLKEERHQLIMALLELDAIPSGMELFPASDDDSWTVIQRVINECDYYIVVVGGRYGSIGPNGRSYTEMEYDYAVSIGKPVLSFIHSDPGSLPRDRCEGSDEGQTKLLAFHKKLKARNCKFYDNPTDLGGKASRSFVQLLKTHPADGWVRAKHAAPEFLARLAELKEENDRLRQEIEQLRDSAKELAQGEDLFEMHPLTSGGTEIGKFTISWDDLFAAILPCLIDEASEITIVEKTQQIFDYPAEFLNDTDFETMIIQMRALGLIELSTRPRWPRGGRPWWKLTPKGHDYLIRLRAISRDKSSK